MPQYDMLPTRGATPQTDPNPDPDPRIVHQLLATLAQISQMDLPDSHDNGFARYALQQSIEMGLVDNLYTPLGSDEWLIAWAEVEPWEDPRVPLTVWREVCDRELAKAREAQKGAAPDA